MGCLGTRRNRRLGAFARAPGAVFSQAPAARRKRTRALIIGQSIGYSHFDSSGMGTGFLHQGVDVIRSWDHRPVMLDLVRVAGFVDRSGTDNPATLSPG